MNNKTIKNIVMVLLLVVASIFLINAGLENYSKIKNEVINLNALSIVVSLIFCVLMLVVKAMFHAFLVNDFICIRNNYKLVLSSYAQSQIIRYLPGKVLGIIFQGERLNNIISRKIVWLVNIWQVLVTNFNGIGIIIFVLLYFYFDVKLIALISLITIPVTYILFKNNCIDILIEVFNKFKYIELSSSLAANKNANFTSLFKSILLQLDWIFYFLFWYFMLPSSTSVVDTLLLGAIYAGAALIGVMVLVVPSGWLVREASFIWIGINLGYTEESLLVLSVMARLITISADVMCAFIFSFKSKLVRSRI